MLSQLVFASQNRGKLAEVIALLAPLGISVSTVADYPQTRSLEVAETAPDFAGNAALKAKAYAQALALPVLADDSGLEVTALGGEPGVASNRWFPGSDADRNEALLARLVGVTDRTARFVSVVCFFDPAEDSLEFFRGEVSGAIAEKPSGDAGFGYDPIFIPTGYTQSFAELGADVKNTLSHRAVALQKFVEWLQKQTT